MNALTSIASLRSIKKFVKNYTTKKIECRGKFINFDSHEIK